MRMVKRLIKIHNRLHVLTELEWSCQNMELDMHIQLIVIIAVIWRGRFEMILGC